MSVVGAIVVPHPPILLPEVGRGEEKKISATDAAYRKAAALVKELDPETIVLLSPHSVMYADYFHISPGSAAKGDMRQFHAPQVKIRAEYDSDFSEALAKVASAEGFPAGTLGERNAELDHGTLIPLYYVNQFLTDYRLVRIGLSGLPLTDHYHLGQLIRQTAEKLDRRTVIIGSGDLSHKLKEDGPYGLAEEGPEYDERIMDVLSRAAFDELLDFDEGFCDRAAECGHRSFCILAPGRIPPGTAWTAGGNGREKAWRKNSETRMLMCGWPAQRSIPGSSGESGRSCRKTFRQRCCPDGRACLSRCIRTGCCADASGRFRP